jgi:hypothetical protein
MFFTRWFKWILQRPDLTFVTSPRLFTRPIYLFLESPVTVKDKGLRESIFQLIGVLVQHYNHALGAATSITHLLPHFEHLAAPLASLVETCVTEYGDTRVLPEVLREITNMDGKDLAQDTSGTRYISTFLSELGTRLPEQILQSSSLVLQFLDCEVYPMRNAAISLLGSMVSKVLVNERSESAIKTRDEFLDILEERLLDHSSYVRSRVLQVRRCAFTLGPRGGLGEDRVSPDVGCMGSLAYSDVSCLSSADVGGTGPVSLCSSDQTSPGVEWCDQPSSGQDKLSAQECH